MCALGEGYEDHFVCKCGELRPPPPPPTPRFFRPFMFVTNNKRQAVPSPPSMLAQRNKHQVVAVSIIYVCTRRRLCGSLCLQVGGLPSPTPLRLKAIDASKCLTFHDFHCFRDVSIFFIICQGQTKGDCAKGLSDFAVLSRFLFDPPPL